jgi:hypothetical protein
MYKEEFLSWFSQGGEHFTTRKLSSKIILVQIWHTETAIKVTEENKRGQKRKL